MKMYRNSSRYSLRPRFDLLFDGELLWTHEEYECLSSGGRQPDELRETVTRVNRRFLKLTGSAGISLSGDSGIQEGEEYSNAAAIYRNKVRLSEEQLIHRWKSPSVAADSLLIHNNTILLVRRADEPYKGHYALPGGILDEYETLEQCALRELFEETGIRGRINRLLTICSDPDRDPRVRMVSAVYLVDFAGGSLKAGDDASSASFFPVNSIPPLAFDHGAVVKAYLESLNIRQRE
jgi:8-oxo-dGTP diphosphatase